MNMYYQVVGFQLPLKKIVVGSLQSKLFHRQWSNGFALDYRGVGYMLVKCKHGRIFESKCNSNFSLARRPVFLSGQARPACMKPGLIFASAGL